MRKSDFIQHILIRSLPALDKAAGAIEYAESLWQQLSQQGYGAPKQQAARDNKDHYQQMNTEQKKLFNAFWKAFNYKHDRNSAAMQWLALGDLTGQQSEQIIKAAAKEASRALPYGQSRKMAQGWLSERRFNDYNISANTNNTTGKQHERSQQLSTLQGIQTLYKMQPSPELKAQIEKLQANMKG